MAAGIVEIVLASQGVCPGEAVLFERRHPEGGAERHRGAQRPVDGQQALSPTEGLRVCIG
jgi:hypothetical protein